MEGIINIEYLKSSLLKIIERHESLRTRIFSSEDGIPFQKIIPINKIQLPFNQIDISNLSNEEQNIRIEQLINGEIVTSFNFKQILIRIKLLTLSSKSNILLINFHHIIFDGWSLNIFLNELSILYNSFTSNIKPSLPILSHQFSDITIWQKSNLSNGIIEKQLKFWNQYLLNSENEILNLPYDKIRPLIQTNKGSTINFRIPNEIVKLINPFTLKHNITSFNLFISIFSILLYKYTNQNNIIISTNVCRKK